MAPPVPAPTNLRDRPRVLCVDDEPHVLESLRDALRRSFDVSVTMNGFAALRMLVDEPYAAVVSDVRMPMLDGTRFLTLARQHAPDTTRIVLTGHASMTDVAAAVNAAEVFRLLVKPCGSKQLTAALQSAVEHGEALRRRRAAVEGDGRATVQALLGMAAAIDPKGPERAARVWQYAAELATAAHVPDPTGDLELACEAILAGAAALPHAARSRLASAARLGRETAAELERLPELAVPYLRGVTALEPVADLLEAASHRFSASRTPAASAVLRIALDYALLEGLEVPMDTALQQLRARRGRYSPDLLTTFEGVLQPG